MWYVIGTEQFLHLSSKPQTEHLKIWLKPRLFKNKIDWRFSFNVCLISFSRIVENEKDENFVHSSGVSSVQRGSAYHEVFQELNFKNLVDIENQIDEIVRNKNFSNLVDSLKIKKIVKMRIFAEISKAKYIFTEKEFFAKLPTDVIEKTKANGEFLLQGVIDLIAIFDDHFVILDYKTGKMNDEKMKNYTLQLSLYSNIAEKIYNIKPSKKVLCLIDEEKIIEI